MGLLGRFMGGEKPEATTEQYTESIEKSAAPEERESPENQKKEVQAALAGSLRNKLGQAKAYASLRFAGMGMGTRAGLLLITVVLAKTMVAGCMDIDTSHLGTLADMINPGDFGHGHDHVLANTGLEGDSGSSVTVEVPTPTPTPEPPPPTKDYGTLDDFYGNKDETTNLVGEDNFASASDAQVKKILDSMHEGSGETNYKPDGVPAPTTETPTPVPTETPTPTTETPTPAPTETPTTPVREVTNLSGPKPDMVDLSSPTPDTVHVGNPEAPDKIIIP